ncbi:DUF6461 domain-containing protein [Actinokineospora guangxiensis]|uniref:DUF6461 domain-containing protein n=1 Tax=Actinokineospora guangxiensis TaxID=1490288 RepID=A0ABW0EYC5_9PSEU
MPSLSQEHYQWVDAMSDLAWSVAVIRGRSAAEVVRTYGGDPLQPQRMTYAEANDWRNQHFNEAGLLLVNQLDQATVVIEPNGWASSIAELARRLSAHDAHFMSVYWSPSAYQVCEAKDGRVTALFDPIYVEPDEPEPRDGERYPAWLKRDEFLADIRIRSSCMTLLEAQTGVRVERWWLEQQLTVFEVPDPDELLAGIARVRLP